MKRVSKCLLGAAVLLLLGEAVCSANLISYSTWPQARDKLMVMDETGGNSVVVLRSKTSWPIRDSAVAVVIPPMPDPMTMASYRSPRLMRPPS